MINEKQLFAGALCAACCGMPFFLLSCSDAGDVPGGDLDAASSDSTEVDALSDSPIQDASGLSDQQDSGSEPQEGGHCKVGGIFSTALETAEPIAAYITSSELAESFKAYAELHSRLDIPSMVITTQQICAGNCNDNDPKHDTAFHIKEWIKKQKNLKYILLAGDIEHVPSRQVHDEFVNDALGISYKADFYTDYYFSDLSQWDTNADGIYAQDGKDEPAYRPNVAVSRLPVSTKEEAQRYYEKLLRYYTAYQPKKVDQVLMLSNVAFTYQAVRVDGAFYFENKGRTHDIVKKGYNSVKRLYAEAIQGAERNTLQKQINEINRGYNLVLHTGHGGEKSLTTEQDGTQEMTAQMAYDLKNSTYPIFLSCACEAATFAVQDSAGEMLMNAPSGGAIAYMGNSAVGLGIAGGMQLLDELVRYIVATDAPILADAYFSAHTKMPESDTFTAPFIPVVLPVVDKNSYEWTQKAVTFFGDFLIPVYKGKLEKPIKLRVTKKPTCEGMWYEIRTDPEVAGTVRVQAGDKYYDTALSGGNARVHLAEDVPIVVSYKTPQRLATITHVP